MAQLTDGKDKQFVSVKDLMEHYAAVRNRLNGRQSQVKKLKDASMVTARFVEPLHFAFTAGILLDYDLRPPTTVVHIIKTACLYFGIPQNEMLSIRRNKRLCTARHIAMYLCHELTNNSYPQIGRKFGGRDHTTVLHAVQKVKGQLSRQSTDAKSAIDSIKEML